MQLTRRFLLGAMALVLVLPLIAQEKPKDDPAKPKADDKKADDKKADEKKADDKKPAEAPSATGDKANIVWKFEKDKTFYQEMTTDTKQTLTVMGQKVEQKQKQTFYFSWTPTAQDKDGNWTVTQKIDGIKMDITINEQVISFDSTAPAAPNNALGEFFRNLVGSQFTLTIGKDMKVSKVEGRDDFVKKLGSANSNMEPLLKKILSDDALKKMADPTFGVVPGKEVTKGESWKQTTDLNLGPIGSYTTVFTYTFDGKEGDNAKIKVATALTYKTPTESGEGLPFRIKSADLKTADGKDAGGTITFNLAKGRLEKSNLSLKLTGSLDIEIGGTTTKVALEQDQTTVVATSDTSPITPKK